MRWGPNLTDFSKAPNISVMPLCRGHLHLYASGCFLFAYRLFYLSPILPIAYFTYRLFYLSPILPIAYFTYRLFYLSPILRIV